MCLGVAFCLLFEDSVSVRAVIILTAVHAVIVRGFAPVGRTVCALKHVGAEAKQDGFNTSE